MEVCTFKQTGKVSLQIYLRFPPDYSQARRFPLIVFFFGGGWVTGTPDHFRRQAEYLSQLGFITACPEYRVQSVHGTTPADACEDAADALRFLIKNHHRFKIDLSKTVVAGGSAGGHLAVCSVILNSDLSSVIHGMVLFNPVLDTSPAGYGCDCFGSQWKHFSPLHNLRCIPPALIFHGAADRTVPFSSAQAFAETARANGCDCTLIRYEHCGHGFFNSDPFFSDTLFRTVQWLRSRGFFPETTQSPDTQVSERSPAS